MAAKVLTTVYSPRIYFTSLLVENLRCFGEKQELKLTDDNGRPSRWTLILGENGVGKTTLLQCLARMRPVPATSQREAKPDKIQPAFSDEDNNDVLLGYIRAGADATLTLEANFCVAQKLGAAARKSKILKTCFRLTRKRSKLVDVHDKGSTKQIRLNKELYVLGYGATRRMGFLNVDSMMLYDPMDSLFDTSIELFDAQVILGILDYAKLRKKSGAENNLKKLMQVLADILPDINDEKDINILGPKISDIPEEESGVRLQTPYGPVPVSRLSLGSQTALAWTVDMAHRMIQRYPDSPNPLSEPGIVLLDEIDLHLHPRWQRQIRAHLTTHFPNIQFIATAHSPVMAQSALDANLVVLRQEGDHVTISNDPVVVKDWRVDQILTSELYGLPTARRLEIEELILEREKILKKHRLNSRDKARIRKLDKVLEELPTVESHEDQKAMDIVRRAAALLEEKG